MTWFHWLVVALWTMSIAAHIALIGTPRGPYTKELALGTLITNGLLIWGMVHFT
jgi:hypothetical protein